MKKINILLGLIICGGIIITSSSFRSTDINNKFFLHSKFLESSNFGNLKRLPGEVNLTLSSNNHELRVTNISWHFRPKFSPSTSFPIRSNKILRAVLLTDDKSQVKGFYLTDTSLASPSQINIEKDIILENHNKDLPKTLRINKGKYSIFHKKLEKAERQSGQQSESLSMVMGR